MFRQMRQTLAFMIVLLLVLVVVQSVGASDFTTYVSTDTDARNCFGYVLPGTYVAFKNQYGITLASGYTGGDGRILRNFSVYPGDDVWVYMQPQGGPMTSKYLLHACSYGGQQFAAIRGVFGWECGETIIIQALQQGCLRPPRY